MNKIIEILNNPNSMGKFFIFIFVFFICLTFVLYLYNFDYQAGYTLVAALISLFAAVVNEAITFLIENIIKNQNKK